MASDDGIVWDTPDDNGIVWDDPLAKKEDPGLLSGTGDYILDIGRKLKSGTGQGISSLGWLTGLEGAEKYGTEMAQAAEAAMSPVGAERSKRPIFTPVDNPDLQAEWEAKIRAGEVNTEAIPFQQLLNFHPSGLAKVPYAIAESVPPMVAGMAASYALEASLPADALIGIGGLTLRALGPLARGAATSPEALAAVGSRVVTTAGLSATEGGQAGAMSGQQTEKQALEYLTANPGALEKSEIGRAALQETNGDVDAAIKLTAARMGMDAFYQVGASTGILALPGSFLESRLLARTANKSLPKEIGIGALGEASQEGPQSAAEEYFGGNIMGQIDPSRKPTLGSVLSAGLEGIAVGAPMGGGMGVFGKVISSPEDPATTLNGMEAAARAELEAAVQAMVGSRDAQVIARAEEARAAALQRLKEINEARQLLLPPPPNTIGGKPFGGEDILEVARNNPDLVPGWRTILESSDIQTVDEMRQALLRAAGQEPRPNIRGQRYDTEALAASGAQSQLAELLRRQQESMVPPATTEQLAYGVANPFAGLSDDGIVAKAEENRGQNPEIDAILDQPIGNVQKAAAIVAKYQESYGTDYGTITGIPELPITNPFTGPTNATQAQLNALGLMDIRARQDAEAALADKEAKQAALLAAARETQGVETRTDEGTGAAGQAAMDLATQTSGRGNAPYEGPNDPTVLNYIRNLPPNTPPSVALMTSELGLTVTEAQDAIKGNTGQNRLLVMKNGVPVTRPARGPGAPASTAASPRGPATNVEDMTGARRTDLSETAGEGVTPEPKVETPARLGPAQRLNAFIDRLRGGQDFTVDQAHRETATAAGTRAKLSDVKARLAALVEEGKLIPFGNGFKRVGTANDVRRMIFNHKAFTRFNVADIARSTGLPYETVFDIASRYAKDPSASETTRGLTQQSDNLLTETGTPGVFERNGTKAPSLPDDTTGFAPERSFTGGGRRLKAVYNEDGTVDYVLVGDEATESEAEEQAGPTPLPGGYQPEPTAQPQPESKASPGPDTRLQPVYDENGFVVSTRTVSADTPFTEDYKGLPLDLLQEKLELSLQNAATARETIAKIGNNPMLVEALETENKKIEAIRSLMPEVQRPKTATQPNAQQPSQPQPKPKPQPAAQPAAQPQQAASPEENIAPAPSLGGTVGAQVLGLSEATADQEAPQGASTASGTNAYAPTNKEALAKARKVVADKLRKLRASGKVGAEVADRISKLLKDTNFNAEEIIRAFAVADALSKTFGGTDADPRVQFFKILADTNPATGELEEIGGEAIAAGKGQRGLVKISLSGNISTSLARDTAFHEGFHFLQDMINEYDPETALFLFGRRTGTDPRTGRGIYSGGAFRDGMTLDDVDPSIKRTLKNAAPEKGGKSYWDILSERYEDDTIKAEFANQREAAAYVFGALADARNNGHQLGGLKPAFRRFLNILTQFAQNLRNVLRSYGYTNVNKVLSDYASGKGQMGFGKDIRGDSASGANAAERSERALIGMSAATFPKELLKEAEQLEAEGAGRIEIYMATGLARGDLDGEWRHEVPDDGSIIKPEALSLISNGAISPYVSEAPIDENGDAIIPLGYQEYNNGKPITLKELEDLYIKNLLAEAANRPGSYTQEELDNIIDEPSEYWDFNEVMNESFPSGSVYTEEGSGRNSKVRVWSPRRSIRKFIKLKDILDHPDLYNAYPDIKELDVVRDTDTTRGGYFSNVKREIGVSERDLDRAMREYNLYGPDGTLDTVRSTLVHEIQHYIQYAEGFVTGLSAKDNLARAKNIIIDQVNKAFVAPIMDIRMAGRKMYALFPELSKRIKKMDPSAPVNNLQAAFQTGDFKSSYFYDEDDYNNFLKKMRSDPETSVIADLAEVSDDLNRIRSKMFEEIEKAGDVSVPLGDMPRYMGIGGEKESRNVEYRLKLSPEERRTKIFGIGDTHPDELQYDLAAGFVRSILNDRSVHGSIADIKMRAEMVSNKVRKLESDLNQPLNKSAYAPERSFVGRNSENWPFQKQRLAEAMEDQGFTPMQVWKSTGLHRGDEDGLWRNEIPDFKAKLNITPEISVRDGEDTLGNILKHDDLFKEYPFLEHVDIFTSNELEEGSALTTDDGDIYISGRDVSAINSGYMNKRDLAARKKELISSILHEVQHVIQRREGFKTGSSAAREREKIEETVNDEMRIIRDAYEDAERPLYNAIRSLERVIEQEFPDGNKFDAVNVMRFLKTGKDLYRGKNKDLEAAVIKKYLPQSKIDKINSALLDNEAHEMDIKDLEEYLVNSYLGNAFGNYMKISGERESRDVQYRFEGRVRKEPPQAVLEREDPQNIINTHNEIAEEVAIEYEKSFKKLFDELKKRNEQYAREIGPSKTALKRLDAEGRRAWKKAMSEWVAEEEDQPPESAYAPERSFTGKQTEPEFKRGSIADTNTMAFKRWFKNSVVRAPDTFKMIIDPKTGQRIKEAIMVPLKVYHGGSFMRGRDIPMMGKKDGADFPYDFMHFGTKAAALARTSTFDEAGAEAKGMDVTPAYLSIQKPKYVKDQGTTAKWAKVVEQAKAEGYDGLIYTNEYEDVGSTSYVIFDPGQAKSTDNVGTFNFADPRMERAFVGKRPTPPKRSIADLERNLQQIRDAGGRKGFINTGKRAAALSNWITTKFDPKGTLPKKDVYRVLKNLLMGNVKAIEVNANALRMIIEKGTKEQRRQIFDYFKTKNAVLPNTMPADLRDAAMKAKAEIAHIGRQLVAKGILTQKQVDAEDGQYLPRLYMQYLKEAKGFGTGSIRGSNRDYTMKKSDIPEDIRKAMGEILEPGLPYMKAAVLPVRDMAIIDFLSDIASFEDAEWVAKGDLVDWRGTKVSPFWLSEQMRDVRDNMLYFQDDPATLATMKKVADEMQAIIDKTDMREDVGKDFKRLPNTSRYGALRGMAVRKEIYQDIAGMGTWTGDLDFFSKLFSNGGAVPRVINFWKLSKTVFSPTTHARQLFSNMVTADISGVNMQDIPVRMVQAIDDMINDTGGWKIAKENGVTATGVVDEELRSALKDLKKIAKASTGGVFSVVDLNKWSDHWITKLAPSNLYQGSDYLFKTIKIIDEMKRYEKKLGPPKDAEDRRLREGAAVLEANEWFMDYSDVHDWVKSARQTYLPFITYQYKIAPKIAETLLKNPQRFAKYVALFYAAPALAMAMMDLDDDDMERLKNDTKSYVRKNPHAIPLPWQDASGDFQFLDIGYLFPWSFMSGLAAAAYNTVTGDDGWSDLVKATSIFGSPLITVPTAAGSNIDTFSGQKIVNQYDTPFEKAKDVLGYIWGQAMPPIFTNYGAIGGPLADWFSGNRGDIDRKGNPKRDTAQLFAQAFGFNIYPVNPAQQFAQNVTMMQNDINRAKADLSTQLNDKSLSLENRRKMIEDRSADIRRRIENMQKYIAEARPTERLLKK